MTVDECGVVQKFMKEVEAIWAGIIAPQAGIERSGKRIVGSNRSSGLDLSSSAQGTSRSDRAATCSGGGRNTTFVAGTGCSGRRISLARL